jgi:hypothetical protein
MYDTESTNDALLHHALQTMEMHKWWKSRKDLWYSFPRVGAYLPTSSINYTNLQYEIFHPYLSIIYHIHPAQLEPTSLNVLQQKIN